MSAEPVVESVLVAELGRSLTRTYLVDVVDGEYRFVARGEAVSTIEPPHDDLTLGLQTAVQQIEHIAGRKLLRRERLTMPQSANGDGVDSFVVLANVGDPLRVAVLDAGAGPTEVAAITEAMRRQEVMVYTVTAPARGAKLSEWAAQQRALIASWQPHVLLFIAGTTPVSELFTRMITIAQGVTGSSSSAVTRIDTSTSSPTIFTLMTEALHAQLVEQIGSRANIRLLAGVTPTNLSERLVQELGKLTDERWAQTVQGYDTIGTWSRAPVIGRQRAASLVAHYLARSTGRPVTLVDIEEEVGVYGATPDRPASAVLGDINLGIGMTNLLGVASSAAVRAWLPITMAEDEVRHWALNRSLRPLTVALDLRDQLIEQAFVREAIRLAIARLGSDFAQTAEMLIGSRRFYRWSAAAAVLTLLDGVQPMPASGAVILALDSQGVLPAMGALAQTEPSVAAAVLDRDALTVLGTALIISGGNEGQRVASGTVRRADGRQEELEVVAGSLVRVPLAVNEAALIRLTLENRATLGTYRAGQTIQFEAPKHIGGGQIGLVIDARSRPITPGDERRRSDRVREWLHALGDGAR